MVAPIRFLSGRQQQQKIGVEGSTENDKVLEVVGRAGIGTTIFEPSTELEVRGNVKVSETSTFDGLVDINAGGQANTFKVEDLTSGRVVTAGVDGELEDSDNLRFSGTELFINGNFDLNGDADISNNLRVGSAFTAVGVASLSDNVTIGGNLDVTTGNTTIGGDLSVTGIGGSLANVTLASAGGITTTGGTLYVGDALSIRGNTDGQRAVFTELFVESGGNTIEIVDNKIKTPSQLIIDPAVHDDNSGSVRIKGDLYVDGDEFVVSSGTIELADFVVAIASTVPTNTLLDGAGIGIGSTGSGVNFLYEHNGGVNPSLKSSQNLNIATGKVFQIGETERLSADRLSLGNQITLTNNSDNLSVLGGNVGIGTTLPTGTLHVRSGISSVKIQSITNTESSILSIGGTSNDDNKVLGNIIGQGNENDIASIEFFQNETLNSTGALRFKTANSAGLSTVPAMTIGPTGEIAIGWTSGAQSPYMPTQGLALEVIGNTELDNLNVSGVGTIATLQVGVSTIGITTVLDEDDMSSDSDTALATQQSIKKYVDDQITAQDLDIQGDTGGALSIDLDSETLTIAGTTNEIETVGSGNTITIGLPDNVSISTSLTSKQIVASYYGESHKNDYNEITVTVAAKTSDHPSDGAGDFFAFFLDGDEAPYIQFIPGKTYRFVQEDSSNTNHLIKFYLDVDKNTEYIDSSITSNGVPGNSGAYTEITVSKTTPSILYYQSQVDPLMGNQIQTVGTFVQLDHNVGLGTTNPTQQLQVGDQFVVTSTGSAGLGTLTPTAKLDVVGQTELDNLNVSIAATTVDLNATGFTTVTTLFVGSASTFRDDVTVLLDGTSAIGIGTTEFTPVDEYVVDIRGKVNIEGSLVVGGTDIGDEVTSPTGNFTSIASTDINITGVATFGPISTIDAKNGIGVTGGDASIGDVGSGFYYDDSSARVGIGSTIPEYKLDVVGDIHATGYTSTRYLTIGTGSSEYTFPDYDGSSNTFLKTDGNGNLDWFTSTTVRQTTEVTAGSGQTTFNVDYTPGLIDVFINGILLSETDYVGTSGTNIVLNVGASASDIVQFTTFSADSVSSRKILEFWDGDDLGNVYNTTDNIGIGVSSPTQLLDVDGDVRIRGGLYDSVNTSGAILEVPVSDGAGGWSWSAVPSTGVSTAGGSPRNVQFHNAIGVIGGSNEFNFDFSTQRVGIGTTIPSKKLDVRGGIYVSDDIHVVGVSSLGTVQISSGIVTANSGVVTYYGDGSNLTDLNADQLTSGTIPSGRLSGTYNIDITGSIAGSASDSIGVGTVTAEYTVNVGAGNTGVFANSSGDLDVSNNLDVSGIGTIASLVVGSSTTVTSIDDDLSSVSSDHDTLASAKAVKDYVDTQIGLQDLDVQAGSGSTFSVDLDTQVLSIKGTSDQIDVVSAGNTITFSLSPTFVNSGVVTANAGFANTLSFSNSVSNVTNTISPTAIFDDLDATVYRTVEYSIQATEGSNYHFTKLLAVSSGTTAYVSEYGTVYNNSTVASYNVDIAGGYIRLVATATTSSTTNYVINFMANQIF